MKTQKKEKRHNDHRKRKRYLLGQRDVIKMKNKEESKKGQTFINAKHEKET
jgi:hypothetical protein